MVWLLCCAVLYAQLWSGPLDQAGFLPRYHLSEGGTTPPHPLPPVSSHESGSRFLAGAFPGWATRWACICCTHAYGGGISISSITQKRRDNSSSRGNMRFVDPFSHENGLAGWLVWCSWNRINQPFTGEG